MEESAAEKFVGLFFFCEAKASRLDIGHLKQNLNKLLEDGLDNYFFGCSVQARGSWLAPWNSEAFIPPGSQLFNHAE
jgi:hypothetical protein